MEQHGRGRPPLSGLNGSPLTLDTSMATAKHSIHVGPDSNSPRTAEIGRLKSVIKTKDACLYNFSKTLRDADEKARQAEKELQAERAQYQTLQVTYEQLVRSSVNKQEALQAEVRRLAIQLAETHNPGDAKIYEEMSIWKAEVHNVLDLARRELAAAQDENKMMRGELAGMEERFAHDRRVVISEKKHIQTLEYEKQDLHTKLEQAEEELKRMAREANVSQAESRASMLEYESKIESVSAKAVWVQGLLNERERLHDEAEEQRRCAEEQRRVAEEKKNAAEQLLMQAGQDLREAKNYINQLQLQLETARQNTQAATDKEMTQEVSLASLSPDVSITSQEHEYNAGEKDAALLFAEARVQELQQELQRTRQKMEQLQQLAHETAAAAVAVQEQHSPKQQTGDRTDHSSSPNNGAASPASPVAANGGEKSAVDKSAERNEIVRLKAEIASEKEKRDREVEEVRALLCTMELNMKEQVSHLVKSKEREFSLTSDQVDADRKLRQAEEDKKSAHVQLEAVMRNFKLLKAELEALKSRASVASNVKGDVAELENRAMQKKLEQMKHEYVSLQASHESEVRELRKSINFVSSPPASPASHAVIGSWPKGMRPPGVFSDYSPFVPGDELEQISKERLRDRIRDLSERLQETENTLEQGKRDMIELLKLNDSKDCQIAELLAASFRRYDPSRNEQPGIARSVPPPPPFTIPPSTGNSHVDEMSHESSAATDLSAAPHPIGPPPVRSTLFDEPEYTDPLCLHIGNQYSSTVTEESFPRIGAVLGGMERRNRMVSGDTARSHVPVHARAGTPFAEHSAPGPSIYAPMPGLDLYASTAASTEASLYASRPEASLYASVSSAPLPLTSSSPPTSGGGVGNASVLGYFHDDVSNSQDLYATMGNPEQSPQAVIAESRNLPPQFQAQHFTILDGGQQKFDINVADAMLPHFATGSSYL